MLHLAPNNTRDRFSNTFHLSESYVPSDWR
jgi:hypothetical protein